MRSVIARSVFSALALVSVLMQGACGTGASGDITGNDSGPEARVAGPGLQNMEGTWIGTNESVQLVWRLSRARRGRHRDRPGDRERVERS